MIAALVLAAILLAFLLGWTACALAYRHIARQLNRPLGRVLDFTPRPERGQDARRPW